RLGSDEPPHIVRQSLVHLPFEESTQRLTLPESPIRSGSDAQPRLIRSLLGVALKYQPQFPQRFGCIEDAKTFCRSFFDWYNQDHHHAGIGLMTPDQVHYGQADQVYAARQITLDGAFSKNPERFVRKEPEPPAKPIATWINPPSRQPAVQA